MSDPAHPQFETRLDRSIFLTIRGSTPERPQTLADILGGVDAIERIVLSLDELAGGLERLNRTGWVLESAPHRYIEGSGVTPADALTAITAADHAAACAEIDRRARAPRAASSGDEFVRKKLALRWATPGGRWPTVADEEDVERLARAVDSALAASGVGEVNGFESGTGHIDVLVFARADADVDQLHALVVAPFAAHGCPPGSRILRFDADGDEILRPDPSRD